MRIRFTLDIERRQPPQPTQTTDIFESSGSAIENAGRQSMGFTIPHGMEPATYETEDHR